MSRVPWVFGCLNFTSLVVAAAAAYMLRWAHGNIASNFREIFVFFHAAATSSENVLGISDSPDIDLQLRKMKESQNAVP